jgi:8-oxo-dGTP pyrophosphatase MutT (NUDIX family)
LVFISSHRFRSNTISVVNGFQGGSAPALPLREAVLRDIQAALRAHPRRMVDIPERRRAAVLLMLFERHAEPWIVLTKRSQGVRSHKGEISFPGGSQDQTDADLWGTAVRETVEELGVDPAALQPLGALDDYPTFSSGFVVSAFVAAVDPPQRWRPSEHEIDEVIELPLDVLAQSHRTEVWEREGIRFPMHIFEVDGCYIWGVTAFILRRFLDVIGSVPSARSSGN